MQDLEERAVFKNNVSNLLAHYRDYVQARKRFLTTISLPTSCRDPLAEFSETLVAAILDAKMAGSRVQKGYDLIRQNNRRVQVRYLCNPNQGWINEHYIYFAEGVDDYALVIIGGLDLESVLVFPKETISQVAKLLNKRHPKQDISIQFTQKNYRTILAKGSDFANLGVEIYQFLDAIRLHVDMEK